MKEKLGNYIQEYSVRNKAGEDIPVYSVTNTQGFCKDYFGKEVASKDKTTYKVVPRGFFAYNPSRINVGSVDYQRYEDRVIVSPLYNVFSVSEELDKQYLYYYLKSNIALQRIRTVASGSVRDNLKLSMLYEFPINLKCIDEQKDVVRKLDKVRLVVDLRKAELQQLDELVKSRFVEMFGDPVVNSMSWVEELIGDSCFVTKLAGFEYTQYIHYEDSGDVVMVKAQNVKNGKLNRKDLSFISNEVSNLLPRSQLEVGDVVMTYVGANIGDVAVIDGEYKYHLAPNVAKIRPNAERYNSVYFMYMLMFLNSYIVGNSADTAKAALGMEKIRKLKVFVPPVELQEQFSAFVGQIDKSKVVVQKALDEAQTLFDSLMQEYFG
ncbi:MAG: restriction endonuclease subunit S [Acutalibacteraceae bacterium]|nr:restriction endonuclease subunit S [Acutalibacteraceae bacterium]